MKKYFLNSVLIIAYFLLTHPLQVYAEYMLPYPSTMPGNKIYKISRVLDSLKAYWYVGDIAQVKYHLMLSDKYLVESKTLFEYKQYLLARDALKRSDVHFTALKEALVHIKQSGKNVTESSRTVSEAADAHIQVLNTLQNVMPEVFDWIPEKGEKTHISITELLSNAKQIRMSVRQTIEK